MIFDVIFYIWREADFIMNHLSGKAAKMPSYFYCRKRCFNNFTLIQFFFKGKTLSSKCNLLYREIRWFKPLCRWKKSTEKFYFVCLFPTINSSTQNRWSHLIIVNRRPSIRLKNLLVINGNNLNYDTLLISWKKDRNNIFRLSKIWNIME